MMTSCIIRCVGCKKALGTSGTTIKGFRNQYRVCRECLEKAIPQIEKCNNKTAETRKRKEIIQKQVVDKMIHYCIEV